MNISTNSRYGSKWSREELILVLYLYCQIPFAKTIKSNPEVIRLSQIIGRTPSSIAFKLGNFGAFDERLAAKGIVGLKHFGKMDREVWDEFYEHWDLLIEESQKILKVMGVKGLNNSEDDTELPILSYIDAPTEKMGVVSIRLQQSFFRKTVMASYANSCCICGIDVPELIIASHIIPWGIREDTRIDPQNGLTLCALHDKAFDRGFISIDSNLKVVVSPRLSSSNSKFVYTTLINYKDAQIQLPSRFLPKPEYLSWHLYNTFR